MSGLALKRIEPARPTQRGDRAPTAVLAQRRSSFGPGAVAAPAITEAGRPLDAGVRGVMETGFGRDFSQVRVHDDAKAHDAARSLDARAYAAGDHIVFGEGAYRPETGSGQALIAHELAHSVQQAGVQMKADGPLPAGADAELEAQADRAAAAVTSGRPAPALSRIGAPAVFRAKSDAPAGGATAPVQPGPAQRLPPDMLAIRDDPPGIGTTELVVALTNFTLPEPKGFGPWVQKVYDEAGGGGRLIFNPVIEGGRISALKEGDADYKSVWLRNFGFNTTREVADAFRAAGGKKDQVTAALADPGVAKLVGGLDKHFQAAGCDIDHIVEKQIGGTSMPSNLQLLTASTNQKSGRKAYEALIDRVKEIRDPSMRGTGVRKIQLQMKAATVPAGTSDASFIVEDLLRRGQVKGSDAVKAKAEGTPVALSAGGMGETVRVQEKGPTNIDIMARRIVPGVRLTTYTRGPGGRNSKADKVEGELDSLTLSRTNIKNAEVSFTAEPAAKATPIGAAAAGAAAEENAAASESRVLKLDKAGKQKIGFYYPYLSPGQLTPESLDGTGALIGTGIIKPSVPFFGDLKIRYQGHEVLEVVAPLSADKLKPPIQGFRFTEGELVLALSPAFVPKGNLKFEIGPKARPVVLGDLMAKYEGGAFIATGALKPGAKIPGIADAAGQVEYHSTKGWSGKLTATSSTMGKATQVSAELGFDSEKGAFRAFGKGGITTKVRDADLNLQIRWRGDEVSYWGGVTVPKPLPLVDKVRLEGEYEKDTLRLKGDAAITFKGAQSTMTVIYVRKEGQEDRFSGKAGVDIKTDKMSGRLDLNFSESGRFTGKGLIGYQVTKTLRPELGVEIAEENRIKVLGSVSVADIALTKRWPKPEGGEIPIIKGVGLKFSIPTPIPAVTAYGEVRGSLSVGYGVGPVMLKAVKFAGELYPFEDDPKIKAELSGRLSVPAYGELKGKFGAYIGAEVLFGVAGAKGGIDVKPTLGVKGDGGLDFKADYQAGGFSFGAKAFARGSMYAKLNVDLMAEIYALGGLISHTWEYPVASVSKQLGPELVITLGEIAYSRTGEITWPDPSQIDVNPKDIDPLQIVKELLGEGKSPAREQAKAQLREAGLGHLLE